MRELRLLKRIFQTSFNIFAPYELNFAITYRCNAKCKTCNIWKTSCEELSLREIQILAKKNRFIAWLRLTGGEPFLRSDYVEIVKAFKHVALLSTPTNALLPEIVEKNVRDVLHFFKGRYVITVSLDGPKDIHDEIRGVESAWEKAIETYIRLKRFERNRKFKVFFGYTISPFNVGLFKETIESVKDEIPFITPDDFHINIFQISEIYYHTHLSDFNFDLNEFRRKASREIKEIMRIRRKKSAISLIENLYLKLSLKYLETGKVPIRCNIYNLSCFLAPNGDVYPCTIFNEKLGNIKNACYDLMKILSSKKSKETREKIRKNLCPQCWTPCEAHQLIVSNLMRCMKDVTFKSLGEV